MRVNKGAKNPVEYYEGHNKREEGLALNPPYSVVSESTQYHWFCAGWNDADIHMKGVKNVR